uniref:Uncharacterized protein n=1 Tax=viral metagenome TaxID=1070528 RepID=A0A6C0ERK4_9ZZZZ
MPGSDASQFTRFKKANAVQRGDTQQSNRLTQYVSKLTGASCQTVFLDSLMPKSRRALCNNNQSGNVYRTNLDFNGVVGASNNGIVTYTLLNPPITPNNEFFFKIVNLSGNILSITFNPSRGEANFNNSVVELLGGGNGSIKIEDSIEISEITGFNNNSIIHITFPGQISSIGDVTITTSDGGGNEDLGTITKVFNFTGIALNKGNYILEGLTINPSISGKYKFTFSNVSGNPYIAQIQLGNTDNFPTATFTINGSNVTPESIGGNRLKFSHVDIRASTIILRVLVPGGINSLPFQFDTLSLSPPDSI